MKPHLCAGLCLLGRETADINPRRILLVFCFQPQNIPGGWAGLSRGWSHCIQLGKEQMDVSHVFLFFCKVAQRVLKPPVLCGSNQKQQAKHQPGGGSTGRRPSLLPARCSGGIRLAVVPGCPSWHTASIVPTSFLSDPETCCRSGQCPSSERRASCSSAHGRGSPVVMKQRPGFRVGLPG